MSTIEEQYQEALRKKRRKEKTFWGVVRVFILVGIFIGATLFVSKFVVGVYGVPTASMMTTIIPGEKILTNQLYPDFFDISRGDIIVFEDPGTWLTPIEKNSGNTLVKRVIAIGGDTIECCDINGSIVVNNQSIAEGYIDKRDVPSTLEFSEKVPNGYVFVMGDNRSESNDSRYNDESNGGKFISLNNIKGKAIYIIAPGMRELQ